MELELEGRKVYAATGGRSFDRRKPSLLFIHGAGQDHTVWQLPARYFAWHGYAAIALDLPGHGRSDGPPLQSIAAAASWIGRVMDCLGLGAAALIGHSMGAAIAIEAAAARAERISRLAVLGTGFAMPVNDALLAASLAAPEAAFAMIVGWGHGPRAKIGGNAAPGLWMTGFATALLSRNRPGVLHADLAACKAWTSGKEAASRVRCPALVLMGARDAMTPPSAGHALARCLAAGRSVSIADCGHMLMAEAPDATLDALIGFFLSPPQLDAGR
jgi:pimeloyl-ACP methyl ester carboxylesterase